MSLTLWGNLALVSLAASILLIAALHLAGAAPAVVVTVGWLPFALALLALGPYLRARVVLTDEAACIRNPLRPRKVVPLGAIVSVGPSDTLYSIVGAFARLGTATFVTVDGARHEAQLAGGGTKRQRAENHRRLREWCTRHGVTFDIDEGHLGQLP